MAVTASTAPTENKNSFLKPFSVMVTYAIVAHLLLKGSKPGAPEKAAPAVASHDFSAMAGQSSKGRGRDARSSRLLCNTHHIKRTLHTTQSAKTISTDVSCHALDAMLT
jgi:hypothetical protein